MDAHSTVTAEEGDRYPLGPPSCQGTPSLNGGQHWAYEVGDRSSLKSATLTLTKKCLTMNQGLDVPKGSDWRIKRSIKGLVTNK